MCLLAEPDRSCISYNILKRNHILGEVALTFASHLRQKCPYFYQHPKLGSITNAQTDARERRKIPPWIWSAAIVRRSVLGWLGSINKAARNSRDMASWVKPPTIQKLWATHQPSNHSIIFSSHTWESELAAALRWRKLSWCWGFLSRCPSGMLRKVVTCCICCILVSSSHSTFNALICSILPGMVIPLNLQCSSRDLLVLSVYKALPVRSSLWVDFENLWFTLVDSFLLPPHMYNVSCDWGNEIIS